MLFLGRIRETNKIASCLKKKENIILAGKFGMGKTSLVRNIAGLLETDWKFVFVDFSKTPGDMARKIAAQLIAPKKIKTGFSYKKALFLLNSGNFSDGRQPVIVLDNIVSITARKVSFLNHLTFEKRFSFIAIADSSFAGRGLFRLRSCLFPAHLIKLGYLHRKDIIEFFRTSSNNYGLNWDEAHIKALVSSMNGYPLSMKEIITREVQKRKSS